MTGIGIGKGGMNGGAMCAAIIGGASNGAVPIACACACMAYACASCCW